MSTQRRVLVVEDEPVIHQTVADRLAAEGYDVVSAYDGPAAVEAFARHAPDLVLLDVMLPGFDGYEVCRRIQAERPVPVLMLTARDEETDVLVGLGVGADDYLTKPFRMRELTARVAALLRRVERAAELAGRRPIEVGGLRIDNAARRVWRDGEEVRLTPTEFDLLACLAADPGAVVTRERLLADVWGWPGASGTRTVDSHVKGLRAKIGADRVRTVHGVGYALEPDGGGMTPLARVRSLKVKLGLLVAASVAVAAVVASVGRAGGVPALLSIPVTIVVALAVTQLLAVGMVAPLREMTAAARRMARGDYAVRVTDTSTDEVGELARAFNRMARDLATVDQQRRDLVANVSHELRTPLAGLRAVLENLADGVGPRDPAALEAALGQAERLSDLVEDLLDLARVDAGRAALVPRDVDLASPPRGGGRGGPGLGPPGDLRRPGARRPRGARRPGAAAAAGRQPARQRRSAQPGRRHGRGLRDRRRAPLPARGP
ncbi:response regulator [Nocardioides sp. TF02-7]|uniref:response regulator n=1 Tax=Nocardioides sp. TF02-7 TaxID=2917724 RepID=UPI001F069FC2|nr:response regulator [Nocardioides sp. TF02-7]UMG91935.1 response regulator [Nocardioides sp. TF02-7]